MDKHILEVCHAPTDRIYQCLCLNREQFTEDCRAYILDRFADFSVNPDLRFYSRIDKLIDDISHDKLELPYKFKMRMESRHTHENRPVLFTFCIAGSDCLQCNVFLHGLSEEMHKTCMDNRIDFVVIYNGVQGVKQEDGMTAKGGFCGIQPQVPSLAGGACPAR